jgi:biopolymer transport protein ExbD
MNFRLNECLAKKELSFNMTPVIDIVFLLIIFFVVVFQFIGSDDSIVNLPEDCDFAQKLDENKPWPATITLKADDADKITVSIGGQTIDTGNKNELMGLMQKSLDETLSILPPDEKIVVLRIDKNVNYRDAQYALAAAANSSANRLRLATLAEQEPRQD